MRRNNQVGCIPTQTPILWRLKKAIDDAFDELTEEELIDLEKEIESVGDANCRWQIKEIADMYAQSVKIVLHGI